jgi:hypothetical protein
VPAEVSSSEALVTRYLGAVAGHDWEAARACLSEDVIRVGPFGDTYTPRDAYLSFLADLMPTLPGYSMRIERVRDLPGGVVAEPTPECLVFELDADDSITHIAVYLQRLSETPGN